MARDFEIIEHTADIGIIAYGKDVSEAFANAARGMFSLITELISIRELLNREVKVAAPDREGLLVAWLDELIYLFDTEHLLFKRFQVRVAADEKGLSAQCYGEKVDRARHELKLGIKATTYHMLSVAKDDGYKARVIFDI